LPEGFYTIIRSFERVYFTTDESSQNTSKSAIDPEKLGRVFEKLLQHKLMNRKEGYKQKERLYTS
jgi:hypothetical protein